MIARSVARRTDLRTVDLRGHHAALRRDAAALARELRARAPTQLAALGYDERFRRLWRLYLRYCEAGFAERRIGDVQTVLAKPLARASTRSPRRRRGQSRAAAG